MGIKRFIFNLMLSISRAKLKRGLSIYGVRSDYKLFGKVINFLSSTPHDVKIEKDSLDGINCLRFTPPSLDHRVILFLHGGAFVINLDDLKEAYMAFSAQLAKDSGCEVWVLDYRTAPENPYPIAQQDCIQAYEALIQRGYKPEDICIVGDSCGAGLALSSVLWLRDHGRPLPGSIATISAWADLSLTGNSLYTRSDRDPMFRVDPIQGFANHYLQGASPHDPYASPHYGDYTGFPPMYMMVGGREMLHDDTTRIAEKAKEVGVDVTLDDDDNMIHIYPVFFGIIPEGKAAIERLAEFVKTKTALEHVQTVRRRRSSKG